MTTSIEWTDEVWGVAVGCSRVSAGCERCYAERVAHRGLIERHRGLTVIGEKGPRWNGTVRFVPEVLAKPLLWKRPRRVFVNSMSDLFHESLTNEQIAAVFGVMASAPQHTFQILTKRPKRMREWFDWVLEQLDGPRSWCLYQMLCVAEPAMEGPIHDRCGNPFGPWPLPNVSLGVSVEDQETADKRLPWLIDEDLPAAVRFVSYEPALGPVDFTSIDILGQTRKPVHEHDPVVRMNALTGHVRGPDEMIGVHLDWIIVGGESGPGARPFDLAWARSVLDQARDAGVPVFVKQFGAHVMSRDTRDWVGHRGHVAPTGNGLEERWRIVLNDRAGGDMCEWPADLRVRMFPGDAYVEGPPTKPMRPSCLITKTGAEVHGE